MHGTRHWMAERPTLADCYPGQIADLADEIRSRPFSSHAAKSAFLAYYESLKR